MEVVSAFTQELLKQLMPWLASLFVALIVKWAGELWAQFKAAQPDKAAVLQRVAEMAVYAAEQAGIKKEVEDKKLFALSWAESFLQKNYGLKLDLVDISNAIEAEVRKMNELNEPIILPNPTAGEGE